MDPQYKEGFGVGFFTGVILGMAIVVIIQALCIAINKYENTPGSVEHMAPVNIKSTNRHWRFYSPYGFGLAGPAGTLAGSLDRSVINVSQLQRDEDLAQSRKYKIPQAYEAPRNFREANISV